MTDQPIVRRLDHVNIVVPRPRALFGFLTQQLRIPIERPWARFPAFESGQAMLGIGHEPITYAPGRRTGVPTDAGLFALAFEPEPIARVHQELARRGIPHSVPFEFAVTYSVDPDAFALDELAGDGRRRRRWTLITVGGCSATRRRRTHYRAGPDEATSSARRRSGGPSGDSRAGDSAAR